MTWSYLLFTHRLHYMSQMRSRTETDAAVPLTVITAGLRLNHSLTIAEDVLQAGNSSSHRWTLPVLNRGCRIKVPVWTCLP